MYYYTIVCIKIKVYAGNLERKLTESSGMKQRMQRKKDFFAEVLLKIGLCSLCYALRNVPAFRVLRLTRNGAYARWM